MNIFIMVLVFIFMAGYYLLDSPSQKNPNQDIEYAVTQSELHGMAECAVSAHARALRGIKYEMHCTEMYGVKSENFCTNEREMVTDCASFSKGNNAVTGYMITTTFPIQLSATNDMMKIIEKWYPDISNFGLAMTNGNEAHIMTASGNHPIPVAIKTAANLETGQIIYMTQYAVQPPTEITDTNITEDIICDKNQIKAFRFNKWQCIDRNEQRVCTGDTIWDEDKGKCVPNPRSVPICSSGQAAIQVNDVWQCVDPSLNKQCANGKMAKLDYATMQWVCVSDPSATISVSKCGSSSNTISECTDCEKMITDSETCNTFCVPDSSKIDDPACYTDANECTGSARAFYFGFPADTTYVLNAKANISAISEYEIPYDISHSQNRKFNCLDCGAGFINSQASVPPYIAVCSD